MGKDRRYDQEYRDIVVELFKSYLTVPEIGKEYSVANSTLSGCINKSKENKILKQAILEIYNFDFSKVVNLLTFIPSSAIMISVVTMTSDDF